MHSIRITNPGRSIALWHKERDSTQNCQPQYVDALQAGIDQFEITRERQITRNQRKSFWAHKRKHAVALHQGDFGSQSDNNHGSSVYFAGLQLDQPGERQQRLNAIRQLRRKEARQQEEEIRRQMLERIRQKDEERKREEEELLRHQEELMQKQEELMRQQEEFMRQQEEEHRRQEEEEARRRMQAEELKRQREAEELRRTEEIRRQYEEDLRRQQARRTRLQEEARRAQARGSRNKAKVERFAQIERYNLRWTNLRNRRDPQATPLTFQQIPWPVFDPAPKKPADLSTDRIQHFISYPDRPLIERGGVTGVLKVELLRWHPDKIGFLLACVREEDRDAVKEGLEIVARILTDMKQV